MSKKLQQPHVKLTALSGDISIFIYKMCIEYVVDYGGPVPRIWLDADLRITHAEVLSADGIVEHVLNKSTSDRDRYRERKRIGSQIQDWHIQQLINMERRDESYDQIQSEEAGLTVDEPPLESKISHLMDHLLFISLYL